MKTTNQVRDGKSIIGRARLCRAVIRSIWGSTESRPAASIQLHPDGEELSAFSRVSSISRLIILLLFLAFPLQAQIQQSWVAHYNNGITNGTQQALKMALDSTGNIYVTGFSQNTKSNLGCVTIKYSERQPALGLPL
jgi:hypothetical protein